MNNKSEQVVDVRELIDRQPFGAYQWLILITGILVLMLDGYDVGAIGFIAPKLMGEWNIARPDLAPVLTAALVGLAIGAIGAGPLADRVGRKPVVTVAAFLFGLFTVLSAMAQSLQALTWLRFATGLGLGAAFPNTVTLVSEFCPQRRRSLLISLLLTGFVFGTALGGYVAAGIIERFGWRTVLMIGGVIPLVLSVWLAVGLPESMRFLVTRGNADAHIRKILRRIAPSAADAATSFTATDPVNTPRRAPIRAIFSDGLAVGTALLWLVYFGGLVVVYFVLSWMPTLAKQHGYTLETAANISALFTLVGPVGALIAGWLMDRYSPHVIIGVCYLLGALFLWQVGLHIDSLQLLYLSVGLAGFFINASQSTISALAARFYPTVGRATGVSSMMGVGRFGGILGAASGGYLLSHEVSFANIFLLMALAASVAGLAVLFKGFYYRKWSI